ncbi:MAG: hypothetical protein QF502_04205 [Nitrospinaceae bacterium]|jgi:hypothetical protein|nr:hypothetical protein [Nitrospinaceae bacterium]MDP7058483.1 hypothetical protein [Nitrospinaceae bacterium]
MWENVFVESRLLSALVFGGFYTHSNVLEEEVEVSDKSIRELSARQRLVHMNVSFPPLSPTTLDNHLSGNSSKPAIAHLSGIPQYLLPAQP